MLMKTTSFFLRKLVKKFDETLKMNSMLIQIDLKFKYYHHTIHQI